MDDKNESNKKYFQVVPDEENGELILFTLSTCIWCKKTKSLLKELGWKYSFVDMDLLNDDEENEAYRLMEKYNPDDNFPTLVIDDGKKVIIGYQEEEIKKLYGQSN